VDKASCADRRGVVCQQVREAVVRQSALGLTAEVDNSRGEGGNAVDQLRFDAGLGSYSISVRSDAVGIFAGLGGHYFQVQIEVGIPEVGPEAGQLLQLETTLYVPRQTGPRVPLASANVSVAFKPTGEVRRSTVQYVITNAQLRALDQQRVGDLRLELQFSGFLPQATGYPGSSEITEYIGIAESRWRQQLAGLGRMFGVDMLIPFPADDEPRRDVADYLREAQRLLGGNEIDSAIAQVRKALETIKTVCGWNWPGKKTREERTADERWAFIRAALEDQASGAMHIDAGTKGHAYSRTDVETLIGMTAAMLSVVP
jgi:hypothetical protein